jgi:hypothetical protein
MKHVTVNMATFVGNVQSSAAQLTLYVDKEKLLEAVDRLLDRVLNEVEPHQSVSISARVAKCVTEGSRRGEDVNSFCLCIQHNGRGVEQVRRLCIRPIAYDHTLLMFCIQEMAQIASYDFSDVDSFAGSLWGECTSSVSSVS